MNPSQRNVVLSAVKACRGFARCSGSFFNFKKRSGGWRGWENWLTVDITRHLNDPHVLPFCRYSYEGQRLKGKLDIYVEAPFRIAVEIKTSYIFDREIEAWGADITLTDGVFHDARKICKLEPKIGKLLLLSICFESRDALKKYRKRAECGLASSFKSFQYHRWYDCSASAGHNLLLALSNRAGLPQ